MRALDEVGVPVIAPVDVLMVRPVGSDGEIEKVTGDVPPDDVTGVKLVATTLAVKVSTSEERRVGKECHGWGV